MQYYNRINIKDPVAIEKLIAFRRREWKQAKLDPRTRPVTLAIIERKGRWAVKQLQRINATVQHGVMVYKPSKQSAYGFNMAE